jgi:hypothetical protein
VVYIRRTPQRQQIFERIQMQIEAGAAPLLSVIADNDTRWNSTHVMLQRALKLKSSINLFVSDTTDLLRDLGRVICHS